jgi:Tfp pilus assembly protein PilO
MDIDNIIEKKKKEIETLNEIFQKREIEIKATEEKMLDCLFKKCDDLAANIEDKKADLAEINAIIEERKSELTNLSLIATAVTAVTAVTTDSNTQTNSVNPVNHMITEY